jgi:hypothetical protein
LQNLLPSADPPPNRSPIGFLGLIAFYSGIAFLLLLILIFAAWRQDDTSTFRYVGF